MDVACAELSRHAAGERESKESLTAKNLERAERNRGSRFSALSAFSAAKSPQATSRGAHAKSRISSETKKRLSVRVEPRRNRTLLNTVKSSDAFERSSAIVVVFR